MPAMKCLVLEQVLELARVAPDALLPDRQGQARVVGVGAELVIEARRSADRGPPAPGRPCPSGSGRGSGPRRLASSAGSQAAARVQRARPAGAGPAPAGPRRSPGRGPSSSAASSPGAASWNRPVSIGLNTTDRDRARPAGTCRAGGPLRPAGRRGAPSSAGVPRTASGASATAVTDRAAGQSRMERLGDDGQVGQLRHAATIVGRENRVLDSPGPTRQDSRRSSPAAIDHEGAN